MKHTNLLYGILLLVASMVLVACEDSDPATGPIGQGTLPPEPPTVDEMKVTSELPTYVFPHQYTEVAERLVARMKNIVSALSPEVETVILHNEHINGLTDEQYKLLLQIFLHDGNLVIIEPMIPQWNQFIERLEAARSLLQPNECPEDFEASIGTLEMALKSFRNSRNNTSTSTIYVSNNGEDSLDEHFFDIIFLRDNDIHYVDDLLDPDDPTTETVKFQNTDENGNPTDEIVVEYEVKRDFSAYDYGLYADRLCQNINAKTTHKQAKANLLAEGRKLLATRGGEQHKLQDLMSAQTVRWESWSYNCFKNWNSIEIIYDIWAVHDLSKKEDIYMVRQQVNVDNSTLNCGPEDQTQFWVMNDHIKSFFGVKKDSRWYGPYMKDFTVQTTLAGDQISQGYIRDAQPATMTGSSSVTSGFSWNIGGSGGVGLGISEQGPNAGLNIGITGGVSFNETYTSQIPDLSIAQNKVSQGIKWYYEGPTVYQNDYNGFKNVTHALAAGVQKNRCSVNNTFMWVQPQGKGTYTLKSHSNLGVEIIAHWVKNLVSMRLTSRRDSHDYNFEIKLTAPNRKAVPCKMRYEPAGPIQGATDLSDFLAKNYSNIGWREDLMLCSPNVSDDTAKLAKEYLDKLIPLLKKDKQFWINSGKGGIYNIFISDTENNRIAEARLEIK